MGYLIVEMIVLLLIAAVIGFIVGWFFRRGGNASADIEADYKARLEAAEARAASLNKEVEDDQAEIGRLREQLDEARREIGEARAKLEATAGDDSAIRDKESALAAALNDVSNRDSEIERLRGELSVVSAGADSGEQIASLNADIERLNAELAAAQSAHSDCKANASQLNARIAELEAQLAASPSDTADAGAEAAVTSAEDVGPRPDWLLDQPDGDVDDLKRIKGVGPVMERTMNDLGIYHFRQVARLDEAGIKWVSANIQTFPDRIKRDQWVEQARELHTKKYGSAP